MCTIAMIFAYRYNIADIFTCRRCDKSASTLAAASYILFFLFIKYVRYINVYFAFSLCKLLKTSRLYNILEYIVQSRVWNSNITVKRNRNSWVLFVGNSYFLCL